MTQSFFRLFILATGFTVLASASPMSGTISGTCGFYQGSSSNVVYSQNFSGSGTFCTGFMTGGFFNATESIQVGDIFASTSHSFVGSAPTGYTEFANINTTYQVTQQYLFTPNVQPTTSTGTLYLTTDPGGFEAGSTGACSETASLNNIRNTTNSGSVIVPFTTGQPILVNITETATLTCNLVFLTSSGGGFTEAGSARQAVAMATVFDANNRYGGGAFYQTVTPEPGTLWLIASAGLAFVLKRRTQSFR